MTTTTAKQTRGAPERPSDTSKRVAKAIAVFKEIVLPYPRQQLLIRELDELRLTGMETRGEPQNGLRLLADTGSGKTWGAKQFQRYVERLEEHPPGTRPVLIVKLDATGTPRSLFSSILTALDDDFADKGTEQTLKRRVIQSFKRDETQLLIIDEVHHLGKRASFGNDVTDTLKSFLDSGLVPVAFLGTEEARGLFRSNAELNGRLLSPCELPPLDWSVEEDQEIFTEFAKGLDAAVVDRGILRLPAKLGETILAGQLCEASNGIIGQLCRIVQEALRVAVRRSADCIAFDDLVNAVDSWSIPQGFISYNPLRGEKPPIPEKR
jgi:hypothetical protein